jgi:hypothetical protein
MTTLALLVSEAPNLFLTLVIFYGHKMFKYFPQVIPMSDFIKHFSSVIYNTFIIS